MAFQSLNFSRTVNKQDVICYSILSSSFDSFSCDDGHGDYNRSYDNGYDDFDYADYSTDKDDNNFRTKEKKRRKSQKQIIEDILNRWD